MTKNQQIKLINRAFDALEVLNNQTMSPLRNRYLSQNIEEEKGHRRFKPDGVRCGLTIREAARLFCVRQIAEYLNGAETPAPNQWLHLRLSNLTACALVAEYGEQIKAAWAEFGIAIDDLLALDYAELNK